MQNVDANKKVKKVANFENMYQQKPYTFSYFKKSDLDLPFHPVVTNIFEMIAMNGL